MTKQAPILNAEMTKTAPVPVCHVGPWCFGFAWSLVLGHWSLALLVGCNSGSVSGTVPASGKVTYKGAPVEGAIVTFVPQGNGRTATATTRAGGVFSLTTVDSSGALPGKYRVTVDKVEYGAGTSPSMEEAAEQGK